MCCATCMECGNDVASVHFCLDCADELCGVCRTHVRPCDQCVKDTRNMACTHGTRSVFGPVQKWGYDMTKIPEGPVDG